MHITIRLLVVFICCSCSVFAQPEKLKNYRKFDNRIMHFGFMLGFNQSDLNTYPIVGAYEKYGLVSLENSKQPGGQVGVLTTIKLGHPVVRLRFIPTLSFQERVLKYYYPPIEAGKKEFINEERINSVSLDFPLMLQFRTLRYNNFAAYFLAGGQYSLDLQSQERATQSDVDPFVKLRKHDFQGQAGAGVEFFFPYFKMGFEVKFSHSFKNVMIQDNSPVSLPIDKIYNRVWWFSIIFEG